MKKLLLILPLVILLCFIFGCKKGEDVAAEQETKPTITVDNAISADGVSIAYEVIGEGEPALVFVHGWSNNRGVWDAQAKHFSQKYKVVTLDLAGFGESGNTRNEWTMEAFGYDVVAVLDKLNLENVILVGLSMGAPVVIEAAELKPGKITGIVLVDFLKDIETVYSQEDINNSDKAFMELVTEPSIEKSEPYFIQNRSELAARYVNMIADVSKVGWSESLRNTWLWCFDKCAESLQNIQAPVVSINADQSPTNVEAFRKYVPSFQAKIIAGIGHFVPWEAPDEFNRLLEETIQEFIQRKF